MATKIDLYGNVKGVPLKQTTPVSSPYLAKEPVATTTPVVKETPLPKPTNQPTQSNVQPNNTVINRSNTVNNANNNINSKPITKPTNGMPKDDNNAVVFTAEELLADKLVAEGKLIPAGYREPSKAETPKTDEMLAQYNQDIKKADEDTLKQQEILSNTQKGVEDLNRKLESERLITQQKSEQLKVEEDAKILSENNTVINNLQTQMLKDLAAAGVADGDTASMNSALRQKYNAYKGQIDLLNTSNAIVSGNVSVAKSIVNDYYNRTIGYLSEQGNNYQALMTSTANELNRLTGVKESAVKNKYNLLQEEIAYEFQKKASYDKVIQSPAYNNAVRDYGLQMSDDINTQIRKISQAEQDRANITNLMKEYPDANISYLDTSEQIYNKIKNSGKYQNSLEGNTQSQISKRAIDLTKQLQEYDSYRYPDALSAQSDANRIATLEYSGISTEAAIQSIVGTRSKSSNQVISELDPISSRVINKAGMKESEMKDTKNRLNNYLKEGKYTDYASDVLGVAIQGMTSEERKAVNTSNYLDEAMKVLSPKLEQLYKYTGGGSGYFVKLGEEGLNFIGETTNISPEAKTLLAEINATSKRVLQSYTKLQSGVAFSEKELERYAAIMPNLYKSQELNKGVIDALKSGNDTLRKSVYMNVLSESDLAKLSDINATNSSFIIDNKKPILSSMASAANLKSPTYINKYQDKSSNAGQYIGECGNYANNFLVEMGGERIFGNSYTDKIKAVQNKNGITDKEQINNYQYKFGDVIVQNTGTEFGHVAIVEKYDPINNTITLTESNFNNDLKVSHGRVIPVSSSSITGILPLKNIIK